MQNTQTQVQPVRWLRLKQLKEIRNRGSSSLWNDVKAGMLPPPVHIGPNSSAWPSHEIAQIDQARLAGADDSAIKALVIALVAARTTAP
jgi:prophage regulatory protein